MCMLVDESELILLNDIIRIFKEEAPAIDQKLVIPRLTLGHVLGLYITGVAIFMHESCQIRLSLPFTNNAVSPQLFHLHSISGFSGLPLIRPPLEVAD